MFADKETAEEFTIKYNIYDYEIILKELEDGTWAIIKLNTFIEPFNLIDEESDWW